LDEPFVLLAKTIPRNTHSLMCYREFMPWHIYSGAASRANFSIAMNREIWGAKYDFFSELISGDTVFFHHAISANRKPAPRGFPKYCTFDEFTGILESVTEVVLTSDSYISDTRIWLDDDYPYRFNFKIISKEKQVILNDSTISESIRSAIHSSLKVRSKPMRPDSSIMQSPLAEPLEKEQRAHSHPKKDEGMENIQINVRSSFVSRNLKLAEDRGHGEAKLYVGPVRIQDEFDTFMLDWHPMNTYDIDHGGLLLYMQEVESEFSRQSKYKAVSKRLFNELLQKVEKFDDMRVDLSKHTDSSRYYIRGRNDAWMLLRDICLPLITTIVIERKEIHDEGFADYRIHVLKANQALKKNPTSGQRIRSKKRRKVKRKRKVSSDPLNSRAISDELKDRIWHRDQGMCQANWRIESYLDKNLGDICGSNENIEFDHIVPFSRGGKTTYRNLQLLCKKHNRMKSDREV
jgi:5-methylcytosine-specific restriction endonuclease McrA